jgi:hypothetical protein
LIAASKRLRGFTYTHKPVEGDTPLAKNNRALIKSGNSNGFTINLSANGINHADELVKLNVAPVVTILSSKETRTSFLSSAGNRITVCPAVLRDNVTCESCRLCAIPTRKSIIGFPAHGTRKYKVDTTLLDS